MRASTAGFIRQLATSNSICPLRNGRKSSLVGQLVGPDAGFIPTGNLAFGPDGQLYFNYSTDKINAANSQLYTVNTFTGELTAVGSGLGTQILALFSDGTALCGVDTFTNSNAGIYKINTASGVATRVSTVTGLPLAVATMSTRRPRFFIDGFIITCPQNKRVFVRV